uniref:Uncharacterized protein n=1 Tax=Cliftonaea pectinata TaxID=2007206 RepID=A0A1Z1MQZ1_9FLOR|nr:hypothetical protein [Cliftonaea pectinata]ARW68185.1 hypothetical protein [Cliftonaea pectinata]
MVCHFDLSNCFKFLLFLLVLYNELLDFSYNLYGKF